MRYSKFSRAPFHNKKEINGTDAVLKLTHTPTLRPTLKKFFFQNSLITKFGILKKMTPNIPRKWDLESQAKLKLPFP